MPGASEILQGIATMMEKSFLPVMKLMDKKLEIDLRSQKNIVNLTNGLRQLAALMGHTQVIDTMKDSDTKEYYNKSS